MSALFKIRGYYRPQRSCGQGNIFTPVCHSVHRVGVCLSACWDATTTPLPRRPPCKGDPPAKETPLPRRPPTKETPHRRHPPGRSPPAYGLLECILVSMSLPSATKLRRLCFYRRVSVHRGGVYLSECWDPTRSRHPPGSRPPHGIPLGADTHPPGADNPPPGEKATAADGTHPTGMHSCCFKLC